METIKKEEIAISILGSFSIPRAWLRLLKPIFASQPLAATAEGKYWFSLGSGSPRWQCGPQPAGMPHALYHKLRHARDRDLTPGLIYGEAQASQC